MRNIGLVLQYDGTRYSGFQLQRNGVSVQAVLEEAIRAVTGNPEAKISAAAGRTDAGVHARGQVVNFHTDSAVPAERFHLALNIKLPPDVRAIRAWDAPPEFHARFSAIAKTYTYTIDNGPVPSALRRPHAYHWAPALNIDAMQEAACELVGEHDFAAFRASGGAAKTSVRHMLACSVSAVLEPSGLPLLSGAPLAGDHRFVALRLTANGFLYNMVRIIAGTLLEVGAGKRTVADVAMALVKPVRANAGVTLPPGGLCLEQVDYRQRTTGDGA